MNILPHKSWHVRTKQNIARVRKDQAKAAEEEAEKQRRIAVADYEARIDLLRKRSNNASSTQTTAAIESTSIVPAEDIPTGSKHIDLFADHEDKVKKVKPMDEEKRQEQEKYEKQIGYLTYLGQDTHEALGTRSWYDVAPKRSDASEETGESIEIGLKVKHLHDPMLQFLKKSTTIVTSEKTKVEPKPTESTIVPLPIESSSRKRKHSSSPKHKFSDKKKSKKSKKKHKKDKKKRKHLSSDERSGDSDAEQLRQIKQQNLQKLREERLQRERDEQNRAKEFLREKFPALLPPEEKKEKSTPVTVTNQTVRVPFVKQKYNSQFNPMLAKQNYS